uniref:Uncharacterized protein n=1 Tax=Toxoplasma gondii TgCATBr9 TaxID=943120 RepID=A0A2T6J238_TOXGO|nr:hypothetical protein TGBR9_380930 [Toxoplasma gondii TgCATBr9]
MEEKGGDRMEETKGERARLRTARRRRCDRKRTGRVRRFPIAMVFRFREKKRSRTRAARQAEKSVRTPGNDEERRSLRRCQKLQKTGKASEAGVEAGIQKGSFFTRRNAQASGFALGAEAARQSRSPMPS